MSLPYQQNSLMFQAFEWYLPGTSVNIHSNGAVDQNDSSSNSHWQRLAAQLEDLHALGVTSIWIPPACKATNPKDNGYGIYDLFDLGEFDTKGSIATKWGTKSQLQKLCKEAKDLGIAVIFDAVLNHRAAADGSEEALAVRVDPNNRTRDLDQSPSIIEAWTRFEYTSRSGTYSNMSYNKAHFSGVDWDAKSRHKAIFKLIGTRSDGSKKDWAKEVAHSECGNYDYLIFADVDFNEPEVQRDVVSWGKWLIDEVPGIRGMRLDAIKHYSSSFQQDFVKTVKAHAERADQPFFFVGEYWLDNSRYLSKFLKSFGDALHLFDVRLLYNLHNISTGKIKDLRKIFHGTLVTLEPSKAVTFVTNHDTQAGQSLAAPVESWFIPHAYALILLRQEGLPCVFWGDLYGTHGPHARLPECGGRLSRLIKARQLYAYGEQLCDMSTTKNKKCIAWLRRFEMLGHGSVCLATILSTSWSWERKTLKLGLEYAGQIFTDIMGWCWSGVQISSDGIGTFPVGPRGISVWTAKDAPGRQEIDNLIYPGVPETDEEEDTSHDVVAPMDL